ncbi:GNAT family N-acetyltransferase [Micromonospora zingiberis]|uniref:GNAT family N-acetyltransferase n=1 Tax=Micromonospora zingiberis TaxID=2053011 RepID=A0A4V2LWC3_9ACTN|nr:GNAT family N-acetyltransferase [Micromonospora zingiberis]TCB95935.1 GNAT family N-acetyltransferase [Micromonospora zingiberis]
MTSSVLDRIERNRLTTSERSRIRRVTTTKRVVDAVLGGVLMLLATPVFLVVAAAILLCDGRPVLFSQPRLGYRDRPFTLHKFRTMRASADARIAGRDDRQRLTALGRFLRTTSLDELPQLLNVVRGEMSLVGPRPLFTRYLPYYRDDERLRHAVRPGITGLAQVSGRNHLGWDERLQTDVEYVVRASLRTDMRILWRTVVGIVRRRDVVVIPGDQGEPLDTERSYPSLGAVTLRRLRGSDLEQRVHWMNDPRTRQHTQITPVTLAATQEWFTRVRQDPDRHDLVVIDKAGGGTLGMAGLIPRTAGEAEFYVFVDPERYGRGIGRTATQLVCRWAFERLSLESILLTVHQDNDAACRIYASLGFRDVARADGRRSMTLSRADFLAAQAAGSTTRPAGVVVR